MKFMDAGSIIILIGGMIIGGGMLLMFGLGGGTKK